jgi:hypothetical protein
MSASSKTPIYGPEPWATTSKTAWSYWDLWFCVVALADHDGDLGALAEAIEEGGRLSGGRTAEAKLSHLDDLKRRMLQAGIDAHTLVAGEDTSPRIRAKARTKVPGQGLYPRDMTEPMWHTPTRAPVRAGAARPLAPVPGLAGAVLPTAVQRPRRRVSLQGPDVQARAPPGGRDRASQPHDDRQRRGAARCPPCAGGVVLPGDGALR